MFSLISLREEEYAIKYWQTLRPFFCRLSPEYIWEISRNNIIEEINEEIEAKRSNKYEYLTFFTYPTNEQMDEVHSKGGVMFSEVRELVGYRAAEALSLLSGYIRLEKKGDTLNLFNEIFESLWNEFSKHLYHRGFRTAQVRANLVLMLSSNSTFDLVHNDHWQKSMLDFFETDTDSWSGTSLKLLYPEVLKVLGRRIDSESKQNAITEGEINIDNFFGQDIDKLADHLIWEQGVPEEDPYMPSVMMSNQRRGSSEPPSDFYYFPYNKMKVTCKSLFHLKAEKIKVNFQKSALHFIQTLALRSQLVTEIGVNKIFRIDEVEKKCKVDNYTALMIIGQMIKTGLIEFDKYSGVNWNNKEQEYICIKDCETIV